MSWDQRAAALLRALSSPTGIHASAARTANYRAVFTRDAVMAGVAGVLTGDDVLAGAFVRTLEHLRALQGGEGQIASNYEQRDGARGSEPHVSFGTLAPRLDAATWYLVGVAVGARAGVLDADAYRDSVGRVVRLLNAIEYNGRHLLYVPAGGNWADEYVYDGYVLYDQVLRAWGLALCGALYDEPAWRDKAARIGETIAARYWPEDVPDDLPNGSPNNLPNDPPGDLPNGSPRDHPLAAFSPTTVRDVFDLAACALLALTNVAPSLAAPTLDGVARRFLDRGVLPPAFNPVIDETHPDWPALRRYQLHGFRNRPHEYHNGGVWPIWLGWLALAYAQSGRAANAARLRALVDARLTTATSYAFEEYFHGVTGAPGGTRDMAYSATGLLFLGVATSPDAAARLTRLSA